MSELGLPSLARGAVLTLGTFDGVHLGHQEILRDLVARSDRLGLPSVVVTFAPHPLAVLNPAAAPKLLTSPTERLVAIAESAPVHCAVVIPFSREVAALSPDQFVRLLLDRYRMKELVVGYDHGLGRGRQGDVTVLGALGKTLGFDVHVIEARMDSHGIAISSTAIRRAVAYGDLAAARAMLGRRYSFVGTVERGSNRGRSIGIPTLNLAVAGDKLLPPDGVYSVRVASGLGSYGGMMNLGGRPTFGESARVPEIHLFDAGGDWYGQTVAVEFVSRLRDTVRFAGVKELVEQLSKDAAEAKVALTQA
jgi:riboflavin kinase/FMN adenylyltransferase